MPIHDDFTPLQFALRSGAEIGLARAIHNVANPETVGHFIETRLTQLSTHDVGIVRKLAESILAAGKLLSSMPPDEEIEPSAIPTNGDLFADEWEGKRLFWFGEWSIPGEDKWYKFSGTLPDIESPDDIARHAAELAHSYIEAYPTRFLRNLPEYQGEVRVRIIGIEKAF